MTEQLLDFDTLDRQGPAVALYLVRAIMQVPDKKLNHTPGTPLRLVFTINGQSVDFVKFAKTFSKHDEERIAAAAAVALHTVIDLQPLQDLVDNFRRAITHKAAELLSSTLKISYDAALSRIQDGE